MEKKFCLKQNPVYHKIASKLPQMNKCKCNVIFRLKVKIREARAKSTQSCLNNSSEDFCDSLCFKK